MAAAATLARPSPGGDSVWEQLRHSADMACRRSGAYLSGQYNFTFHNETSWTVKMHLLEDVEGAGTRQCTDKAKCGYFLTLPALTSGIEIPMTTSLVIVTAGFFRPDRSSYEIFWESRRFSWEPGLCLSVRPRHSVDANKFCVDVYPGAADADSWAPGPASGQRQAEVVHQPAGCGQRPAVRCGQPAAAAGVTLLPQVSAKAGVDFTVIAYTRVDDSWRSADVAGILPDGSLRLEDGTCGWTVHPEEQATLMPLDWGVFDFRRPRAEFQPEPSAALETPPSWPAPAAPGERGEEGLCHPFPTGNSPSPTLPSIFLMSTDRHGLSLASTMAPGSLSQGQMVEVYSQSKCAWILAQVAELLPDGAVAVECGASKSRRTLRREELARMLKTV